MFLVWVDCLQETKRDLETITVAYNETCQQLAITSRELADTVGVFQNMYISQRQLQQRVFGLVTCCLIISWNYAVYECLARPLALGLLNIFVQNDLNICCLHFFRKLSYCLLRNSLKRKSSKWILNISRKLMILLHRIQSYGNQFLF